MKYFLDRTSRRPRLVLLACMLIALSAAAELPRWIRNTEAGSAIEAAFFRMMPLPAGPVAFRRPPSETRPALGELINAQPRDGELYSLRALEDEQQLDFAAAESDWKSYVNNATDKTGALLALADFYHRRVRPVDEVKALSLIANSPPIPAEKLTPAMQQRSWQAFERIFAVLDAQRMSSDLAIAQYRAWITRYPDEPSLYSRFLRYLVDHKQYRDAGELIADYRKHFHDDVFHIKAEAMLEYRQGSVRQGLAVYEKNFQPLWNPELMKSYFDLLRKTQNLRKFRDDAHAALLANPEDLTAAARLFYYYQQEGKLEAARQVIADFRLHKEARKSAWTPQELFTCARLLEDVHAYPEAARYYYALYNSKGEANAQETAIASLANILLTAPETPIRLGSSDLSMYRDIATMDQGPGYLNGILSLILNTTRPASQYAEEEQRAAPYFHRSRAAELLALLDSRFPNSPRRSPLHAKLLEFYSASGESDSVIQGGREFLGAFPSASERTEVSLLMADAYARKGDTSDEFAIYDSVLQELAAKADHVPLGTNSDRTSEPGTAVSPGGEASDDGEEENDQSENAQTAVARPRAEGSFQLGNTRVTATSTGPRSPEYARVLERYLARLAETKQILAGLTVLRREIDRNPDDPGLYERLAVFVDQNRLGSEEEEVYKRAIARFQSKSWWDKLARFYLRKKRDDDFERLTEDAVKTFQGSDLERYFNDVVAGGSPELYLRINRYAHERFPHNPMFVRNLLGAYQAPETLDLTAWEALIRQHWFEQPELRSQFFELLSRRGTLDSELAAIRQSAPDAAAWQKNPAAATFLADGELWKSHFEASAPMLKVLAAEYPADTHIASTASSVFRSLAYFEPADSAVAAGIEDKLLQANPGDTEIMARVGDIYADRDLFTKAAPYWERIPQVAPGQSSGYLSAATIYWDYFDFDNALRLLSLGRKSLGNPNLYAYEAGAIYENKRDYPAAVDEYVKGALADPGSSAERRLLQLARRPKLRDLIDQASAKATASPIVSMPAVNLRVKVLEAQNRTQDIPAFLDSVLTATRSIEQAEDIESLAQQKSLESVRQHALEKQAALTTDPVTRLQLRYALIPLYESRKNYDDARRNVEALYRENPKILGVVRATVDFYWRMKMTGQAIDVLRDAARDAYPELSRQFSFEAARKLTDVKRFDEAREVLRKLLTDMPNNGEYIAVMADTYAQAGDEHGLQQFYRDEIASFRADTHLSADVRKAQIATLRRGLVPSLTRVKDYAGAIDQYIELINSYPEDEALVAEASFYAQRYGRQQQLAGFYEQTVAKSPHDYRWSMVLARIQTNLENYSAAIDTFAKATAIRPDRVDLLIARAGLEERLMRFDDAIADYQRVYQLSYKAPQWMEKIATLRARQGNVAETQAALEAVLINGRPENPSNYFEVARRLESWGMLPQARAFAEKGTHAAGDDLLTTASYDAGVKTYARLMTRLRQYDAAYQVLEKALKASGSTLPVITQQVRQQGLAALTNSQWRQGVRRARIETARNEFAAALREMAATEDTYFTPEERMAFAHFAEAKRAGMSASDVDQFAIPMAESGNLASQESRWRYELLMQRHIPNNIGTSLGQFVALQRRRGLFSELGEKLEAYATVLLPVQRVTPLISAADAYRSAGDSTNELRVLRRISLTYLDNAHQQRLFALLLARDPNALVAIASAWNAPWGEQAASYIVANGDAALTHAMVQARGQSRPPVWTNAYNALSGLYFAESDSATNSAFLTALGNDPIGARIGKPLDRSRQLAGKVWFYYGSRYGEYVALTKLGDSENYLPATLEESPASASGYITLADYYAGAGDPKRAIIDYQHALDLSPKNPAVIDRLAVAYYTLGDRLAALAQWKRALAVLSDQINAPRVPESFWSDFGRTCDQLAAHKMFAQAKPDVEVVVRSYLRHNGSYRSNAILHSVYAAAPDHAEAAAWLVSLASSAPNPDQVLADIVDISWIPLADRNVIYQHVLLSNRDAAQKLTGMARDNADSDYVQWQVRWIGYLVRAHRFADAAAAIDQVSQQTRQTQSAALIPLELQAGASLGTLDSKLAAYRNDPASAPATELLRTSAQRLLKSGDKQSARKILEYAFARDIEEHQLSAANFLGLAEIRLASGDTAGALELLHRLVTAVGDPLENLEPAAALLERTHHDSEAIPFLEQLVKSAPWEPAYRVRLAKAMIAAAEDPARAHAALVGVAADSQSPYELRAGAASALTGSQSPSLGSDELNLLAQGPGAITATTADKAYFFAARVKAAENSADARAKMQLLTHCIMDFPRREDARVPLFRAAATAQANEFALGIVEPLLTEQILAQPGRAQDVETIASSPETAEDADQPPTNPATLKGLTRAQQADLAQLVGDVMKRIGRLNEAVSYYVTARRLEPAAAAREAIRRKIADVNAIVRRQRVNASRQPEFHQALEQNRLVRPRVVARAGPAPAASTWKGKVKP